MFGNLGHVKKTYFLIVMIAQPCFPQWNPEACIKKHIPSFNNQAKIHLLHCLSKDWNTLLKSVAPNSKLVTQHLEPMETIPGPTHPSCHLVSWFLSVSVTTVLCKGYTPHAVEKVSWEAVQTQFVSSRPTIYVLHMLISEMIHFQLARIGSWKGVLLVWLLVWLMESITLLL